MDFYVYLHRKKTTGEVFYVGKGTRWRAGNKVQRNIFWKRVVKKHGLIVEIVERNIQEWYALELERDLIAYYGRRDIGTGCLVNLTDGGEGSSGYKHTKNSLFKLINQEIWTFKNTETSEIVRSTAYDFQKKFKNVYVRAMMTREGISGGWFIVEKTSALSIEKAINGVAGEYNPNLDTNIYHFYNMQTNQEFRGTRLDFKNEFGLYIGPLFSNSALLTYRDWCLFENKEAARKSDYCRYDLVNKNGEKFIGTRKEFQVKYGFSIADLVRKDFKKRAKQIKGWSLAPQN